MARYTYAKTISIGGDTPTWEGDVEFSFAVASWGRPAQTFGPPEKCWPAEPVEIDDVRVEKVNDCTKGWWGEYQTKEEASDQLVEHLTDRDFAEMEAIALEARAEERAEAMERRWEEARERAWEA